MATVEVVDGSISEIAILEGGEGYERVILHIADAHGSGGLVTGQVTGGRLTQVDLIHSGEGYVDPVVEVYPHFSLGKLWIFWIIDVICCALFMANFIFEHRLADSKKWYWKNNWIDFITSIPLPPFQIIAASGDLGIVRLGRLLRAVRILRALRLFRIALFFWRGMDHLSTTLDVRLLKRSLLYGLLSLVFGAIIFMGVERMEAGSGFGPSLWWSFTTLVTGGYPDIHNPETAPGKILTVFLVITGMVLVGVFTATLTSILVSDEDSLKAEELEEQVGIVTKIQQEIQGHQRTPGPAGGAPFRRSGTRSRSGGTGPAHRAGAPPGRDRQGVGTSCRALSRLTGARTHEGPGGTFLRPRAGSPAVDTRESSGSSTSCRPRGRLHPQRYSGGSKTNPWKNRRCSGDSPRRKSRP